MSLRNARVEYTERWNDFQIVSPTYLDGHFEPDEYRIIKWVQREEPVEITDLSTNRKTMSTEYCFTIGELNWNKKEGCFDFESSGLRFFEHYIDGLNEWIMEFCKDKQQEYLSEEDD